MDYHFISIYQQFLLIFRKNIKKLLIKLKKIYIFKKFIIKVYFKYSINKL